MCIPCLHTGYDPGLRGGGGVLLYMGYTGMCGPKGYYGFSAVLIINRASILADFWPLWSQIGYGFCTDMGMFLSSLRIQPPFIRSRYYVRNAKKEEATFSALSKTKSAKKPSQIMPRLTGI